MVTGGEHFAEQCVCYLVFVKGKNKNLPLRQKKKPLEEYYTEYSRFSEYFSAPAFNLPPYSSPIQQDECYALRMPSYCGLDLANGR